MAQSPNLLTHLTYPCSYGGNGELEDQLGRAKVARLWSSRDIVRAPMLLHARQCPKPIVAVCAVLFRLGSSYSHN